MSPRVLVVDDEAPARRKIRAALAGLAAEIGEAASGPEAVAAIRDSRPDLVFLDVQMPGMTGFEVVEEIGAAAMPPVVFVTAHDDFAVDAFEIDAVDYLLKPFTGDRLRRAYEKATRAAAGGSEADALSRLIARVRPEAPRYLRRLVVRKDDRIVLVPIAEVVRFSAEGNYVRVRTESGSELIRGTLAGLEERLDPDRFCRTHRSEIVRIAAIAEIQPAFHGDYRVVLKNGESVRLSRRYQERLLGREPST